ncbi:stage 0 sporulation protein [Alkalibaculum sp. M08DMB]|uniref:Stage 0 sporulation protein n=1 Tax=Alkalibaculum sporogenes TaxID=2655001 RepID=A0A6A7K7C1_9FIRM|nr:stage 0 sporulation family protein [Alkalibaculum sporogenes]MPW25350.1 stage 0 sporulation protein [Alkalibaculum sporogenes]
MIKVVGIRFKKAGKIYYFDPREVEISVGDSVIVETARGLEYGKTVTPIKFIPEEEVVSPIKPVLRIATSKDEKTYEKNKEKELKAIEICKQKVEKHKLDMKLIDVEYTFDNNKVIFYFTAEGRVDFRELVKDLASIFKIRIELRQIGVRDEAKMLGGLGPCGIPLCCSKWLGDFEPVSIKMAKEQNLSLNPTKISGICGRLLCCLKYEQDFYEEVGKRLPSEGQRVTTPEGKGIIIKINILAESIVVKLDGEDTIVKEYKLEQIKVEKSCKGSCCKKNQLKNKQSNDLTNEEKQELKKLEG